VPSPDRVVFIKELTWQAVRRWWDWDLPDPWRRMDKATYRAVKRRLRRRALREAFREINDE
jgi:protein-tyrosine-phosphatase